MIANVDADINKDGVMSNEAKVMINECLNTSMDSSNQQASKDVLKSENPEYYDKMMYRIGLWYFFCDNYGTEAMKTACDRYLKNLFGEQSSLSEQEKNMAECLYNLGTHWNSLNASEAASKYSAAEDNNVSAVDVFQEVDELVTDLDEKIDHRYLGDVYQRAFTMVYKDDNIKRFAKDGVSLENMNELITKMREGINDVTDQEQKAKLLDQLNGVEIEALYKEHK